MSDAPRLWLPARLKQNDDRGMRPSLVQYNSIREIQPELSNLPSLLADMLARFDRLTTLAIVGNVTARIVQEGADPALHAQLETDLVYPDVLAALQAVRKRSNSDANVVFTRQALLILAKLALGLQRTEPGAEFDQREIGTCVLIMNELLQPTAGRSDDLLMLDTMATWETYAPLDVPAVVARFRLIFRRLRESQHPTILNLRKRLDIDGQLFDGLTYSEFQGLLFSVYLIVKRAIAEAKAPVLTIEPPLPAFLGDEARVRTCLSSRSQRVEQFRDWRYGTWSRERVSELVRDDVFLHDLTTFRQQPFLDLGDRFLLPDYFLALERMTFGSYWTIFDALSGNDRLLFSSAWGVAFEEYVLGLLDAFYPSSSILATVFQRNVSLPQGEIDGVLDFGDHVVVLEVKSSLLPVAVRVARNVEEFKSWVTERLVGVDARGGLRQLAGAAQTLRTKSACVYPVLVTDESSFQAFGVNRYLARCFADLLPVPDGIQPLTLITTDELEQFLPCAADGLVTWRAVFDERARSTDGWWWFGQALRSVLDRAGRIDQVHRNLVLWNEFRAFVGELSQPGTAAASP